MFEPVEDERLATIGETIAVLAACVGFSALGGFIAFLIYEGFRLF